MSTQTERTQKQTNYTHRHQCRPCNHLKLLSLISHTIFAAKKKKEHFVTAMTGDKAPNKIFQVFPAVTDVHAFEACTSITARKLPSMFSQNAVLSLRGQCCVLVIQRNIYILNGCFYFCSDNKATIAEAWHV